MPDTPAVVEFLKRRYARAIECGDDRTSIRLRAEIDRLINGAATAGTGARSHGVAAASSWQWIEPAQIEPASDHGDILGPHA